LRGREREGEREKERRRRDKRESERKKREKKLECFFPPFLSFFSETLNIKQNQMCAKKKRKRNSVFYSAWGK
jgi:hypothetical protein